MDEYSSNMTLWERSSAQYVPVYTVRRTDTVTARNMMIGAIGILFNTVGIIFLSLKKRLKLTLKITMLGMAINDFIFTANALVLSNPNWTWVSHEPYCWPVMYMMASAILTSYFITTLLALHNYVAVAHPLHCDEIITRSRSFIGVLVCFGSGYLVILGCLGIYLSPGVLCTVFTLMPRVGLAVECAFCLTNCSVIVGLNVVISLKIKESRNIAKNGDNKITSKQANTNKKIFQTEHNAQKELYDTLNGRVTNDSPEITHGSSLQGNVSVRADLKLVPCTAITALDCLNYSPFSDDGIRKSIENLTRRRRSMDDLSNDSQSSTPMTVNLQHKVTISEDIKTKNRHIPKRVRRVKTNKTLTILTLWSCLMSLPFLVIMVFVLFLAPYRQTFTTSDMGISIVWLCALHSIGNPLLYIWRFIDWKNVRRMVNARLRKRKG